MYCKFCGKQIDEISLFCSYCGQKQYENVEVTLAAHVKDEPSLLSRYEIEPLEEKEEVLLEPILETPYKKKNFFLRTLLFFVKLFLNILILIVRLILLFFVPVIFLVQLAITYGSYLFGGLLILSSLWHLYYDFYNAGFSIFTFEYEYFYSGTILSIGMNFLGWILIFIAPFVIAILSIIMSLPFTIEFISMRD